MDDSKAIPLFWSRGSRQTPPGELLEDTFGPARLLSEWLKEQQRIILLDNPTPPPLSALRSVCESPGGCFVEVARPVEGGAPLYGFSANLRSREDIIARVGEVEQQGAAWVVLLSGASEVEARELAPDAVILQREPLRRADVGAVLPPQVELEDFLHEASSGLMMGLIAWPELLWIVAELWEEGAGLPSRRNVAEAILAALGVSEPAMLEGTAAAVLSDTAGPPASWPQTAWMLQEYITAHVIRKRSPPAEVLLDLLTHPEDEGVPSVLEGVIGWLADLGEEPLWQPFLVRAPEALLLSTLEGWSNAQRCALAERILEKGVNPDRTMAALANPDLHEVLRPYIQGQQHPEHVRHLAVSMVEAASVVELVPELIARALRSDEPLRRSLVEAIIEIGSDDALRALWPLMEDSGARGELGALVLREHWTRRLISAQVLFAHIRTDPQMVLGPWTLFLQRVPETLRQEDMAAALAWVMEYRDRSSNHSLFQLSDAILGRAVEFWDVPEVREFLLESVERQPNFFGQKHPMIKNIRKNEVQRRLFVVALLERLSAKHRKEMVSRLHTIGLVRESDNSWLGESGCFLNLVTLQLQTPEHLPESEIESESEPAPVLPIQPPGDWFTMWVAVIQQVEEPVTPIEETPAWKLIQYRQALINGAGAHFQKADPTAGDRVLGSNSIGWEALAGLHALRILYRERPDELRSISPSVWAQWIPDVWAWGPILHLPSAELSRYAPDATRSFIENQLATATLSDLSRLIRRYESYYDILPIIVGQLNSCAEGDGREATFLDFILKNKHPAAGEWIETHEITPAIAKVLLRREAGQYWSQLWTWLQAHPEQVEVLAALEDYSDRISFLRRLHPSILADVFLWLEANMAQFTLPPPGLAFRITNSYHLQRLKSHLLTAITGWRDWSAVAALQRLSTARPEYAGIRRTLHETRQRARVETWQPPRPNEVLALLCGDRAGLIRSQRQLLRGVRRELERLVLPDELWRRGEDGTLQPPPAEALAEWLAPSLQEALQGVSVGAVLSVEPAPSSPPHARLSVSAVSSVGIDVWQLSVVLSSEPPDAVGGGEDVVLWGLLRYGDELQRVPDDHPTVVIDLRRVETLQALQRGLSRASVLLGALARESIEVVGVQSVFDEQHWYLRLRLPGGLRERHGLSEQALMLASSDAITMHDLLRARQELYRIGPRLDPDLLILVDPRPELASAIRSIPTWTGQRVPWSVLSEPGQRLSVQLCEHLPTFDLFSPTQGTPPRLGEVFGREKEIEDLSRRILRGDAVGVFGLRKVGKSTAVRAVTDRLDPLTSPAAPPVRAAKPLARVVWLDLQKTLRGDRRRSMEILLQRLTEALAARLHQAELDLPERQGQAGLDELDQLIRVALSSSALPLCVVLDECDYLFGSSDGQGAMPGVRELLAVLRGHAQETGQLSTVLIGRDPKSAQVPLLEGFPNPFMGWFSTRWMPPLLRSEGEVLLKTLGARVGLRLGTQTHAAAWEWTGGHVYLLRQLGSALLQRAQPRGELVDTDPILEEALDMYLDNTEVESLFDEVSALLRERYPAALAFLQDAAREGALALSVERHGGWRAPPMATLRRLGLLQGSAAAPFVPQTFLHHARWAPAVRSA